MFTVLDLFILLFYLYECLPVCMSVKHVCAWHPQMTKEGVRFPGNEVTDGLGPL